MRVITIAALLLFLTSCSSTPETPSTEPDMRFERIASEWQGAHINDMIRVWGDPRLLEQNDERGGEGSAMWAIFSKYTDRRTRCEATATFDAAGLIRDIEVVSINCPPPRRFSWREDWDIEQLRRPAAPGTDGEAAADGR